MNDRPINPTTSREDQAIGDFVRYTLLCGAGAAVSSSVAIAIAAAVNGRPIVQPFNATSHWLWGDHAGREREFSAAFTGTGAVTNGAASLFWGAIFAGHLAMRPHHSTGEILRDAAAMGIVASVVDYGLMPKRLTPGWELALPGRSVAAGMGAMALGLALGALAARRKTMN